jgi:hypothetical protein
MTSKLLNALIATTGLVIFGAGTVSSKYAEQRMHQAYDNIPARVAEIKQELSGLLQGNEPYEQIENLVMDERAIEHSRKLLAELHTYDLSAEREARGDVARNRDLKELGLTAMLGGLVITGLGGYGLLTGKKRKKGGVIRA